MNLAGFYLTDDSATPMKWALPPQDLADGEFLVLWLDGEIGKGANHASLRPNPSGGSLYLYHVSGGETKWIDSVTYPEMAANQAYTRVGGTGDEWLLTNQPTAGAANPSSGALAQQGTGLLLINEFLADNKTTLEDPDEPGAFEDWIEIYNPGPDAVDMSGMYLTDNLHSPTKWQVPAGVSIEPRGYLIFWADNDPGQGRTHTNFQLDADGEEIGLFQADGRTLIDSVAFGVQQPDVSYGRSPDGGAEWAYFSPASPGSANRSPLANWIVNAASLQPGPLAPGAIASAFGQNLATGLAVADGASLPTALGGAAVEVTDSAAITRSAPLYFVSPGQVNFVLPADTALGRARVTIRRAGQEAVSGDNVVAAVAPGLFSATASQAGHVYLTLYGTGIRRVRDPSLVRVEVGDETVPVLYAGPQGEFDGLDQINVGPLPATLAGSAEVPVLVRVDGRRANRVTVGIP